MFWKHEFNATTPVWLEMIESLLTQTAKHNSDENITNKEYFTV